ncbi:MAG: CoA-binding protein [Chloroflexi bacterium]|nr:CoA-binding protein [Chloroflexota bacterium]
MNSNNGINSSNNSFWQNLFAPNSVALIGASNTPGTWGFNIMWRLLASERRIYPVNPNVSEVMGKLAYRRLTDIPDSIDLAVIVVRASLVSAVLQECIQKGVNAAVVISSGFSETGEDGRKLEAEMMETARRGGIRIIGPNTMGHADTSSNVSTLAWTKEIPPGPVGLIAQSGNLGNRIVLQGIDLGIGFSKFVCSGNEADLHFEDYLEYLGQDEDTRIITAYIEGLREGRRFFQLAREITVKKPIIAIKAGGTKEAARAARSHTGALSGSEAVYNAAFRQAGVIRVGGDDELNDVALALLHQPLPRGNRIGILAIGGGLGVVATEACEREGLVIAPLASVTIEKLNALLPPRWPHANPVDLVGIGPTVDNSIILSSLWALMEDENIDAVLLQAPVAIGTNYLSNTFHFNAEEIKVFDDGQKQNLDMLRKRAAEYGKPVLVVTPVNDPETNAYLLREKIPVFTSPHRAARVLHHLTWYRGYLDANQS